MRIVGMERDLRLVSGIIVIIVYTSGRKCGKMSP